MKIKQFKNVYGYEQAECPFCGYYVYLKDYKERKFRNLEHHIMCKAKTEALDVYLNGSTDKPHLDYMKQHAQKNTPKYITSKYIFDNNLN